MSFAEASESFKVRVDIMSRSAVGGWVILEQFVNFIGPVRRIVDALSLSFVCLTFFLVADGAH